MGWRRGAGQDSQDPLRSELARQETLVAAVRTDLYAVTPRFRRSRATTALACSVAERVYRITDALPDLQNSTAGQWRAHLDRVWTFLGGDEQQHYPLSAAVADYLRSPLNHVEGQDGPDDMDRPQTVAALSAVLSSLHWAVDFAEDTLSAFFEAVDLKYEQEYPPEREREVQAAVHEIAADSRTIRDHLQRERELSPELLKRLRR